MSRTWSTAVALVAAVSSLILAGTATPVPARTRMSSPPSQAVFERRIRPLLTAKDPSSCAECHLSGVDLKDYIRPTEAETFTALRQQGLIDLKRPENSRLLRFIKMSRPKSPLVTQNTRNTEYAAFRDWILAAAASPKLANTGSAPVKKGVRVGPNVPTAVIRHTRIDAVVASFQRHVWSQEGRCMNCHVPGNKNIEKFGPRVAWFVPNDPEATMHNLIAQGNVNIEKPDQSLLLLKPLNRVQHGGGVKMVYGDAGYKLFRAWLEDYAASVQGRYRTAQQLPEPPSVDLVYLDTILNLTGGPKAWIDKLARVDVYPWDERRGAWAALPAATGERGMFGGKEKTASSTNLIMFMVVPAANRQTAEADLRARLVSGGRYLLRYYCDTAGKLNNDYTLLTDAAEFYQGHQEITVSSWSGGWAKPVKVPVALSRSAPGTR
jgi:hypothetical protein